MKTKPTWTRYGRGVIMMGRYPTSESKAGDREPKIVPQPPTGKPLEPKKS